MPCSPTIDRLRRTHWLLGTLAGFAALACATPGFGQTLTTSSFYDLNYGSLPSGGTLVDRSNPNIIYGTTLQGGDYNAGAVFKLTGAPGSLLVETQIYSFKAFPDLGGPTGRLYQDASGALYGGCIAGGVPGKSGRFTNSGGIFKLVPPPGGQGQWTETILHTFRAYDPAAGILNSNVSGLVADRYGNLYGTVFIGRGSIFRIRTDGTYRDVHDFEGADGQGPTSPLTVGPDGALYGVTGYGGTHPCNGYGCGTIYKLTPTGMDSLPRFETVFGFDSGKGGHLPAGPVAIDPAGAIYGTNATKKSFDGGVVFKVTPASGTTPAAETVVYDFGGELQPFEGVVFDKMGGIYGTYFQGFTGNTEVYYLPPTAPGSYQYSNLLPLFHLHGGGFHTDGVALSTDPASGDVILDDILVEGLNQNDLNGAAFRLVVKPVVAP